MTVAFLRPRFWSFLELVRGVLDEAGHHDRSTAILRIAADLSLPWSLLRFLRFVPRSLRDAGYDFLALTDHDMATLPDDYRILAGAMELVHGEEITAGTRTRVVQATTSGRASASRRSPDGASITLAMVGSSR